jgi:hypothetical protein
VDLSDLLLAAIRAMAIRIFDDPGGGLEQSESMRQSVR